MPNSICSTTFAEPTEPIVIDENAERVDLILHDDAAPVEVIIGYRNTLHRVVLVPIDGKLNILLDDR